MPQPPQGFEQKLGNAAYSQDHEKTRYDKLLAQSEMQRLRELVSEEKLTINGINEILNILVSTETKLTNFNDNDRYVLGKYLIWISEYGKRYAKAIRAQEQFQKMWGTMSRRHKELRKQIEIDYSESFKQAVHTYCFLGRSPLSIGGSLIKTMTVDRSEMEYKTVPVATAQPQTGFLGRG